MGIYPRTFDFDTLENDTFKSVIFKKKYLTDFLDELGNFKHYTFDFYTFESVLVDAHCLSKLLHYAVHFFQKVF